MNRRIGQREASGAAAGATPFAMLPAVAAPGPAAASEPIEASAVLTERVTAGPAVAASVDLGGAHRNSTAPMTEFVDVAAAIAAPSIERSESGGNQSGGATGVFSRRSRSLPMITLAVTAGGQLTTGRVAHRVRGFAVVH